MNDLDISNARLGFLRINMLSSGVQDPAPVAGLEGIPTVRNYRFTNIRVTDVPVLVTANEIHPEKPLDGLVFENITGTCQKGMLLANMKNVHVSGVRVTGFAGPLLSTYRVTGTGLMGAVALEAPKVPAAVVTAEKPFVLGS